jgi:aminopeptidase N
VSLLRGFSAPVKLMREISVDDLRFLASFDADPVARWETLQELMLRCLLGSLRSHTQAPELRAGVLDALAQLLDQAPSLDPAFVSFMLQLPAEAYVQQFLTDVDPDEVFQAHSSLQREIAKRFRPRFEEIYEQLNQRLTAASTQDPHASRSGRAMGERALRNTALTYLCLSDDVRDLDRALRQRREAKDMTTELGALDALNRSSQAARLTALEEFIGKWRNEPLVVNKWLTIRATSPAPRTLEEIRELMDSPIFDRNNPNKIYSLLLAFARFNQVGFHQKSGAGYRFIADQVLDIDARNPQVASRLVSAFNSWRTYKVDRRELMESELRRVLGEPRLSANVKEIVEKALAPRA